MTINPLIAFDEYTLPATQVFVQKISTLVIQLCFLFAMIYGKVQP